MLEKLREELHRYIEMFGILDERTLKKSQEVDRALYIEHGQQNKGRN